MLSLEFMTYDQLFEKICLFDIIQYPLNSKNIGENFNKASAFLLSVSSIAGGSFTDHATTILSQSHWLKSVKAAIGKRIGIPRPYIMVT